MLVKRWFSSITARITLLSWAILLISTIIYAFFYYINQKNVIQQRMQFEAKNIAESIIQAEGTTIFTEDYGGIIDFCTQLISSSQSMDFIVLSKNTGLSLIFDKKGWRFEELGIKSIKPTERESGQITFVKLFNKEYYLFTKPFIYTGINWGYIHIGISLDSYNKAMENLFSRMMLFSTIFIILGSVVAFRFSQMITKPIGELVSTTYEVERGNLNVQVNIDRKDEIGFLAKSFNLMIDSLRKSTELLESKIKERTYELEQSNLLLIAEINERKKTEEMLKKYTIKLETLEEIYKGIINANSPYEVFSNTTDLIYRKLIQFKIAELSFFDKERRKVLVNICIRTDNSFDVKTEEYDFDNYYGLNKSLDMPYYLQTDMRTAENKNQHEKEIYQRGIISYISLPLHFQNELIGELNFGFDEPLEVEDEKFGILYEISHHISVAIVQLYLAEKLRLNAEELRTSLKEKETLLKEIHHRVKNNLQVVSSLLFLQSKLLHDKEAISVFTETQLRIRSLALVHEKLYRSKNISEINSHEYIKNLLTNIFETYRFNTSDTEIKLDIDDIKLTVDKAVPIGLLLNELITNVIKYAFPQNKMSELQKKFVEIAFKKKEDSKLELLVSDNGVGLPESFDIEKNDSLGLKIVTSLVSQLDGKLLINPKNNTEFRIIFSNN
ncbi:MAG: histidine kinase dimerization/phosphoacceptor domain -containing protein [Candidatus Anstonellales archaeon]